LLHWREALLFCGVLELCGNQGCKNETNLEKHLHKTSHPFDFVTFLLHIAHLILSDSLLLLYPFNAHVYVCSSTYKFVVAVLSSVPKVSAILAKHIKRVSNDSLMKMVCQLTYWHTEEGVSEMELVEITHILVHTVTMLSNDSVVPQTISAR